MTAITIVKENRKSGKSQFRAVAGDEQSVGSTIGEAIDALTAGWNTDIHDAAVLIQRFEPDSYFTEIQHARMQELLARRDVLSSNERLELEGLIDAELEATIARTDNLLPAHKK